MNTPARRGLGAERREIGVEHRLEQLRALDAGGADDLAEGQAAQARGDYVIGGHARDRAEAEALTLMELGRDHARAQRLHAQPLRAEFGVQRLGEGGPLKAIMPETSTIVPSPRANMPGTAARDSRTGARTFTCTSLAALAAGSWANGM